MTDWIIMGISSRGGALARADVYGNGKHYSDIRILRLMSTYEQSSINLLVHDSGDRCPTQRVQVHKNGSLHYNR